MTRANSKIRAFPSESKSALQSSCSVYWISGIELRGHLKVLFICSIRKEFPMMTRMTLILLSAVPFVFADEAVERLTQAKTVFEEVMATPDKGIPRDLLAKAHCVVIVPSLKKGGFIVGAQYG